MKRFNIKTGYYSKGYAEILCDDGEYIKYVDYEKTLPSKQLPKEFMEAAKPLMEFLSNPKVFHPHFTVILDSEHAELVEGYMSCRNIEIEDEDIPYGTCGFCNNEGKITKDPDGSMCDKCWEKD